MNKPRKIIVKINDTFGFVGIETDKIDSGNYIDEENYKEVLGFDEETLIKAKIGVYQYLSDEVRKVFNDVGYYEIPDDFHSNGDVYAHTFILK